MHTSKFVPQNKLENEFISFYSVQPETILEHTDTGTKSLLDSDPGCYLDSGSDVYLYSDPEYNSSSAALEAITTRFDAARRSARHHARSSCAPVVDSSHVPGAELSDAYADNYEYAGMISKAADLTKLQNQKLESTSVTSATSFSTWSVPCKLPSWSDWGVTAL